MYLEEKVAVYRELRLDFTNEKSDTVSRLRKATESEGWRLNEISILQREVDFILKCKFYLDEVNNEVTLTAYRLIVSDLLKLFHVENEGVMNLLEHYFEMTRSDARKSLDVYKTFCTQTAKVVEFFDSARRLQSLLGALVPKVKHAPISLAVTLEEYLNSPDFETNRIEYKANRSAASGATRKASSSTTAPIPDRSNSVSVSQQHTVLPSTKATTTAKHDNDIIDFFSSIDGERTTAQTSVGITGYGTAQGFGAGTSTFAGVDNPFGVGAGPSSSQYTSNGNLFGNVSGNGMGTIPEQHQQLPFGATTAATTMSSMHNPFGSSRQGTVHAFGNQQALSSNPFGGPSHAAVANTYTGNGTYAAPLGPAQQFSMMSSSGTVANNNTNSNVFNNNKYASQFGAPAPFQRQVSGASVGSSSSSNDLFATPNGINGVPFGGSANAFASRNPFTSLPPTVNSVAPQDSLSSLNPFASKPVPATSLPLASMLPPGHSGFGPGPGSTNMGGGGGIFFGGSDAFGSNPGFGTVQNQPYQQQQQQHLQQQRQLSFPQQPNTSPWS